MRRRVLSLWLVMVLGVLGSAWAAPLLSPLSRLAELTWSWIGQTEPTERVVNSEHQRIVGRRPAKAPKDCSWQGPLPPPPPPLPSLTGIDPKRPC